MKAVFVDTSYYLAFVSPTDQWHASAMAWSERIQCPRVTTEFVLVEVGNSLYRDEDRLLFADLLHVVRADQQITVIPATSALFQQGIKLFVDRSDKEWSLTDCISFVVMKNEDLADSLTSDRHFQQAGFRALLLEPAA